MTPLDKIAWLVGPLAPWALVLARTLGLAWTAPALSTQGLGFRARLLLAVTLTALIGPIVARHVSSPPDPASLGLACVAEVVIGAGLGWAGALVIAGARQAGEVVGAQAGLSPAALFDPEAGEGMTAMGHLYGLVALGMFLALDGPTELVRALVESYRAIPAAGPGPSADSAAWAFGQVARALELTLRASAPPALALTMAGLALGLLGRAAPSLQLVALSLPARTLIGLALAALGLATLAATLATAWGRAAPWDLVGRG